MDFTFLRTSHLNDVFVFYFKLIKAVVWYRKFKSAIKS